MRILWTGMRSGISSDRLVVYYGRNYICGWHDMRSSFVFDEKPYSPLPFSLLYYFQFISILLPSLQANSITMSKSFIDAIPKHNISQYEVPGRQLKQEHITFFVIDTSGSMCVTTPVPVAKGIQV